ncbi:hypothetical protein NIES2100_51600 [Calothrix sp. NIES-2100]|uniref:PoNe immunity protein domain-containing protein n=1 Tax=Calothrix sp. NIES-2100 TaxID=1954172 RepID=UPI000B5EC211|nr:hypothetical protein NIES2100_51600 [Calothrix sp. NIES-2100]
MQEQKLTKRETFKEQAYFDEQVRYNTEMLKKFNDVIENPDTGLEHRTNLRHTVFRRQLEQLITRYSRGEKIESLKESFPQIVDALIAYHEEPGHAVYNFKYFDAYIYALWLVSLAILLDIDDDYFNKLIRELNNNRRDAMYESLVALRVSGRSENSEILYPKPYNLLFDALNSTGTEQINLIKKFLTQYYKGMKKAYWYDSHLGEDAGFFGYWCFELAAFVKMLKIDDSSFYENIFYPRDLAR